MTAGSDREKEPETTSALRRCLVSSHNEWDPLEEVIVGIADGARVSQKDSSIRTVDYPDFSADEWRDAPTGAYPRHVIEEMNEDLEVFVEQLTRLDIRVRRPTTIDFALTHSNGRWTSEGYNAYCPRDSATVIGQTLIETPMVVRARYFETFAFRSLFLEYMRSGAKWICAPKPMLEEDLYHLDEQSVPWLGEAEPVFDAANLLRCGRDIFYLVSNSGNRTGAVWLSSVLGDGYRVHVLDRLYTFTHIDTTLLPLRPGVLLANPERLNADNLPALFKTWDIVWCDEPVETEALRAYAPSTKWLAMNVLSLSPTLVAVDARQPKLIRDLEQRGFDVMPVMLRHGRTMRGGPHCATLDVRRSGTLESYW